MSDRATASRLDRARALADRDARLLAAAGTAWMLTQYIAVREIGSTFFSTELVILGAVVVTMIGPSVAFAVAHRLDRWMLAFWGATSVAAILALPFGLRALVGAFSARGVERWALILCAGSGVFLLCGFFAVFLPRAVRTPAELPKRYAAELVGALIALAVILASPSWRVTLGFDWCAATLVVHWGIGRRALTAVVACAAAVLVIAQPQLDRAAAEVYYRGSHGHRRPRIVETSYSPYQRIDIVDDPAGRWLYLDGVPFYGTGDLHAFDVVLADVPAALAGGDRALVVGSGSFSSAAFARRRGYDVTVVELDAEVARIGFRRFAQVHRLARGDVRIVHEDGRRFLALAPPGAFDLIILDVPAPYHIQTALLHTRSFYRLVASRLRPGGVAAISLSDDLEGDVGGAVAASAAAAFRDLVAVHSDNADLTVLYAGDALPFSPQDVGRELAARGEPGRVIDGALVRERIAGRARLTERALGTVLLMSREALPGDDR